MIVAEKIYKIEPDRQVEKKDYWSAPAKNLWLPKLIKIAVNKQQVAEAYDRLSNPPERPSLFVRLKRRFGK